MPHITIQMCHNLPPTSLVSEMGDNSVWCLQLWDHYHASIAIAEACFDGNWEKAEPAIERAYNRIVDGEMKSDDPLTLSEGRDYNLDIFILHSSDEELRAFADKWADIAIKDLPNVGGDDTHYDYYPDYISGLHQLCSQIQYPDPYNRFHDALWATGSPYLDDPETPDMFAGRL
jgi:hypothetical protein